MQGIRFKRTGEVRVVDDAKAARHIAAGTAEAVREASVPKPEKATAPKSSTRKKG